MFSTFTRKRLNNNVLWRRNGRNALKETIIQCVTMFLGQVIWLNEAVNPFAWGVPFWTDSAISALGCRWVRRHSCGRHPQMKTRSPDAQSMRRSALWEWDKSRKCIIWQLCCPFDVFNEYFHRKRTFLAFFTRYFIALPWTHRCSSLHAGRTCCKIKACELK